MKKYILILSAVLLLSCNDGSEKKGVTGKIQYTDYLKCFHEGLTQYDNSLVSLELSGAAYYHDSLFIVSEQRIPGTSSLYASPFTIPFKKINFSPINENDVLNSQNFAGLALTPYQKYMFAITSFTKAEKNITETYTYNMLFFKKLVPPEKLNLAYPTQKNNTRSSVILNSKIRKALRTKLYKKGPPYFKIGGIAAVKNNILLIAICEIGKNSNVNEKVNIIIGAKYKIENNKFSFTEELKELYRFTPEVNYNLKGPLQTTGLEYDIYNDRIYIVTAYKNSDTDNGVGGYIWALPMRDFILKKEPVPVKDEDEMPVRFAHKPGGITVLDKNQILIVFDDDRITGSEHIFDGRKQFKRKLGEAAFTIIETDDE